MTCRYCKGKGEVIIDESHNDVCPKCEGHGTIQIISIAAL